MQFWHSHSVLTRQSKDHFTQIILRTVHMSGPSVNSRNEPSYGTVTAALHAPITHRSKRPHKNNNALTTHSVSSSSTSSSSSSSLPCVTRVGRIERSPSPRKTPILVIMNIIFTRIFITIVQCQQILLKSLTLPSSSSSFFLPFFLSPTQTLKKNKHTHTNVSAYERS